MPPKAPTKLPFFKSIPAAIFSPGFYASIKNRKFGEAFRYILLLTLIVGFAWTAILGVMAYKNREIMTNVIDAFLNIYPEELVLTVTDGEISSNVAEPYFITSETFYEDPTDWEEGDFPINLAVIDTGTAFSMSQFEEYETLAWLTKDALLIRSDNGIDSIPINEIPNAVVDKEMADEFLQGIWSKSKPYIALGVVVAGLVMFIGLMAWRMFYALILAIIVWIAASIMRLKLDYGACYKISLYAMTTGILVMFVVGQTSQWTTFHGFPFMFTVLAAATAIINLINAKNKKLLK